MEWRGNPPPPRPRGERYPTPPPVAHPTLSGRLGRREGVGENDARHRIDRLAQSLALEEEDDVGPPCFGPRIRDGRLGRRKGVGESDARHRIDRLARSLALEEEDDVGPPCFGPRIRDEPFPKGFSLPRDTPKYNGSVKPEDWLIDYSTAVSIAKGNRRVVVKYVPLMLQTRSPQGSRRKRRTPSDRPPGAIPGARRRRRCRPALLWPPHPRRAFPQRVLAPQRHAQVQRLREAGRLADRLLYGSQHS